MPIGDEPSTGRDREEALEAVRAAYSSARHEARANLWDRASRGYARLAGDRDAAIVKHVARVLPTERAGEVLDVGCGTGDLALLVRGAGLRAIYHGIDVMAHRVEQARLRSPEDTFVEGSADRLPFETGAFSVAAAVTLFSSLPTPSMEADVAREIARVLRPGGFLVWYDIRYQNPWNSAVHGIDRRRLRELFPGWTSELRTMTLLPPIARRLGALTPVAYPVLHAIPVFRSHLIGTLQMPR